MVGAEGRSQNGEGGAGPSGIFPEKVRTLTGSTDMRARCRWEANGADADEVERKDEVWQLELRASAPFQRGRPGSGSEAECEHTGTHLV